VRYRRDDGKGENVARGRIRDIYARAGIEYLLLEGGSEIRLDHIVAVDGIAFQDGC